MDVFVVCFDHPEVHQGSRPIGDVSVIGWSENEYLARQYVQEWNRYWNSKELNNCNHACIKVFKCQKFKAYVAINREDSAIDEEYYLDRLKIKVMSSKDNTVSALVTNRAFIISKYTKSIRTRYTKTNLEYIIKFICIILPNLTRLEMIKFEPLMKIGRRLEWYDIDETKLIFSLDAVKKFGVFSIEGV